MGIFLVLVGFAVNFVCGIVILIKAFRVSVGWGLAVMFLPFAGLFFVLNHWKDTQTPFLGGLAGMLLIVLGVIAMPAPEPEPSPAETRRASSSRNSDAPPPATQASAAAPVPASYEPPRSSYQPAAYTPSYNPPPPPVPAVVTDTQLVEDEWTRKPVYEQVYVDRATGMFYGETCRKRPENVYRIPKSVALMQGMAEAKCPTDVKGR